MAYRVVDITYTNLDTGAISRDVYDSDESTGGMAMAMGSLYGYAHALGLRIEDLGVSSGSSESYAMVDSDGVPRVIARMMY